MRIFDQAVAVFGDAEKARRWLRKPKKRFHDRTPLQMLRTDFGGRAVEETDERDFTSTVATRAYFSDWSPGNGFAFEIYGQYIDYCVV